MVGHTFVLLTHGVRGACWRKPLDHLRECLATQQPGVDARLTFLELMASGLPDIIIDLAANSTQSITVVPVLFGQGGHLRHDLPTLVAQCTQIHPTFSIRYADTVDESDVILDTITNCCVRQLD